MSYARGFSIGLFLGCMITICAIWIFLYDPGNLSGDVNKFVGGRADWRFFVFETGKIGFFISIWYAFGIISLMIAPKPAKWFLRRIIGFLEMHIRPAKTLDKKSAKL